MKKSFYTKNFWWGVIAGFSAAVIIFYILLQTSVLKTSLFFNLGSIEEQTEKVLELQAQPNGDSNWGDDVMRETLRLEENAAWGDDVMRETLRLEENAAWGDDVM